MAAKPKPFKTEVELCAAFLSALPEGWTAYNESAGWDILLVRKKDGFQIGIQAKLRLNAHVITQALEDDWAWRSDHAGPDCRAVLVPCGDTGGFSRICDYIGVTVIAMFSDEPGVRWGSPFRPDLPDEVGTGRVYTDEWHEQAPTKRHQLPEYVPDVSAGASAPVQLTRWKISAIKIAIILERRGHLTRADFKHIGIDHRRWPEQNWLRVENGHYVAGHAIPDFRRQHPRVYEEIAADADKWMVGVVPLNEQVGVLI